MIATITRRTLPVQCPACREHLGSGPPVTPCVTCKTAHHTACLVEIGCASLNCATPGGYRDATLPGDNARLRLPLWQGEPTDVNVLVSVDWLAEGHTPFLFSLSADCLARPIYFLCESEESLDDVADWASENAPGLLGEPEYPDGVDGHGTCAECRESGSESADGYGPCEHVTEAESGLDRCDSNLWVPSHLWTVDEIGDVDILATIRMWAFESNLHEERGDMLSQLEDVSHDALNCNGDGCDGDEHDEDTCPFGGSVDVRLMVRAYGGWRLNSGSSDYDQDHRGFWGSASVTGHETEAELGAILDALLDGVADHFATAQEG